MISRFQRGLIVVALLVIFCGQSMLSITSKSATYDEVQYFGIGKYLLQEQKWDVMGAILHPPLSYYLSSLPLLLVNTEQEVWGYKEQLRDIDFLGAIDIYRGQKLLAASTNTDDRLLISSRLMILLLGLLLGYYIYRFSSELYGNNSGILSLCIFTFCPNMLAYSGLIVPDFPLTVFSFIATYHFWASLNNDTYQNRLFAGGSLGLALLSKFSALLLFPCLLLLAIIYARQEKVSVLARVVTIFAIGVILLWLGYAGNLLPWWQGISYQMRHAGDGHAAFLLGMHSDSGWWYYYLVAFLLKTPVPIIVMFIAALYLNRSREKAEKMAELILLLPVIVFFGTFTVMHQSIGLRYILPVYPFLFVMAGSLMQYGDKVRVIACVLTFWLIVTTLTAVPDYLAYFNELAGGSRNGYRSLVDSNLDWGQDLKGLKSYMATKGVKRITLSYFGADSPQRYGIEYDWLPSNYLYNPEPERDWRVMPPGQLLVISATNLQGVYFTDKLLFSWLKQFKPIATIGHSLFIYDLRSRGIM